MNSETEKIDVGFPDIEDLNRPSGLTEDED